MAKQGKVSLFHRRRGLHTPLLKIPIEKENKAVSEKKVSTTSMCHTSCQHLQMNMLFTYIISLWLKFYS